MYFVSSAFKHCLNVHVENLQNSPLSASYTMLTLQEYVTSLNSKYHIPINDAALQLHFSLKNPLNKRLNHKKQ